ncbi:MAG: thiamine pyrophosphate-dependent enzyme [Actinobacteria bacterium]|nr:thiamine pyrophosphate-dependent enzyme [Actinomycetota bacterium]
MARPVNLKKLSDEAWGFAGGHRLCSGCAIAPIIKEILLAAQYPVVLANATGCLEVASTIYPYTSWRVPWIHTAFENAAATISGVETVYRALKEAGKIDKEIRFIAIGGDGGTFDIGLQSLSGAIERWHNFTYICYDNEAYMNTGMQRSSGSTYGSWTTTTPAGKRSFGKSRPAKPLMDIVVAHGLPYAAQASPAYWRDLMTKVQKALDTEGPSFILIIQPCIPGWKIEPNQGIEMARVAVETAYWPLYEVVEGRYRVTVKLKEKKPLVEWLKPQGRFKHLLTPENKSVLEELERQVDEKWERLQRLASESAGEAA